MKKLKRCLLVNPQAGRWRRNEQEIQRLASKSDTAVIELSRDRSAAELLASLHEKGCARVIVCGGDGTLSYLVNAAGDLIGDFEWALVPAGTGNDLARSLGLAALPLAECWSCAIEAPAVPMDVVRVDDGQPHLILNAATGGFGGLSSDEVTREDKERWGATAYWFSAFSHFGQLDSIQVTLEHDEQQESLTAFGLMVANGRYVGGGFPISSDALLDDGLSDVTIVGEMSSIEAIAAGVNLTLGRSLQNDRIRTFRTKRLRVSAKPMLQYSMDGEPSKSLDATFEVLPGILKIVPGSEAPALGEAR